MDRFKGLIKYSEVSRRLTGRSRNITEKKQPEKWERSLSLLESLLEVWEKETRNLYNKK